MAGLAVWRGGSVTQLTWPRPTVRVTWTEKKMSEFVVAVLAFLSMMGAALLGLFSKTRLPSEHLQRRYTQGGRSGGQSLRRDDVAGSRTDDEFGQGHLRNQQPRHSYAGD